MVISYAAANQICQFLAKLGSFASVKDFFSFLLKTPRVCCSTERLTSLEPHLGTSTLSMWLATVLAAETAFFRVEAKINACPPVFSVFKTKLITVEWVSASIFLDSHLCTGFHHLA